MIAIVGSLATRLCVGYGIATINIQKISPKEIQQVFQSLGLIRDPSPAEISFYQKLEGAVIE